MKGDEDDDSSSTYKDEEESAEKTGKGNAKLKVKNTKCSKGKAKKDGDRKRSRKRYSEVWKYFTFETKDGVTKAICCFCDQDLYAHSKKNGTSSLWNHVRRVAVMVFCSTYAPGVSRLVFVMKIL